MVSQEYFVTKVSLIIKLALIIYEVLVDRSNVNQILLGPDQYIDILS